MLADQVERFVEQSRSNAVKNNFPPMLNYRLLLLETYAEAVKEKAGAVNVKTIDTEAPWPSKLPTLK